MKKFLPLFASIAVTTFIAGCNVTVDVPDDEKVSANPTLPGFEGTDPVVGDGRSVQLSWLAPHQRVNGQSLGDSLDGYELRYRAEGDTGYETVILSKNLNRYEVESLSENNYIFEIAAFDTNGLYGDFVTVYE